MLSFWERARLCPDIKANNFLSIHDDADLFVSSLSWHCSLDFCRPLSRLCGGLLMFVGSAVKVMKLQPYHIYLKGPLAAQDYPNLLVELYALQL